MHDFNILQWSFGNTGSQSYADLLNVDIFDPMLPKKLHLSISLFMSSEGSLSIWKLTRLMMMQLVQDSFFFLESSIITKTINTISCFL